MKRILFLLMLPFVAMTSQATKLPDVEGWIVDDEGKPLEFVNVVLLGSDSTFVQGATSDGEGRFRILTPESTGILKVSSIGYATRYVNISDFKGKVEMLADTQMLAEVTVKGQMPKTKLTGNSMVTTIEGTVLGRSGTAKEMLGKVPGMTQRGDDLEVLGKGTPVYYINGRKVQDKDELKRLRSEEIKDVEVITNPGAQYDATVTAVVRIKTIRREGTGFGYDVELSSNNDLRYGYYDPSANLNLRYRTGSLDLFGSLNGWKWDNVNRGYPDQTSFTGYGGQLMSICQSSSFRTNLLGKGLNSTLGFNYQIGDNHSVGMRIERHDTWNKQDLAQNTEIEKWIVPDGQKTAERSSTVQHVASHQPYNWNANAYYNGKFGQLGVDLNVDYLTTKSSDDTAIEDRRDDNSSNMDQLEKTKTRMVAGKLVLSYPVWKGSLNVGSEMTFVKRGSEYSIQGIALPNSCSDIREDNIAAFAEYACFLPSIGSLSAGLRYEHVGFDYKDLLDATKSMKRSTDDVFPSISWARQWGSWQTSLSYSLKTKRPDYWALRDAITYMNPYTLQQGDSKLKNTMSHEIGANIRWKYVNLFMSYERRDNAISQWSYIYNTDGVILIKHINLDVPAHSLAAFLTASPTFGCYSPSWTVGVQNVRMTQTLADPREATGMREVKYRRPILIADLNNAFRFKHSWQLECNMNYVGKGDVMNFRLVKPSINLSFVLQKCWLKNDALCLRASVSDVLQRSSQKIEMDCGYYILNQETHFNRHRLDVTLRYTFNAQKSKYKGTGAGREAAGRMNKQN